MELPELGGAYILVLHLAEVKTIEVGRLGRAEFVTGYYLYVGSAHCPGGLGARVADHLDPRGEPHWHIDYLIKWAQSVEVWYAVADRKLERDWVELLEARFLKGMARFGSSDYRRSRTSHLFYSKRRPTFQWFLQEAFERWDVGVQRFVGRGSSLRK